MKETACAMVRGIGASKFVNIACTIVQICDYFGVNKIDRQSFCD